jgi:hypothetical protein
MAFATVTKLKSMQTSPQLEELIPADKLRSVVNSFKWSGGASKTPHGKSEAEVGLSDDLLEKLFNFSKADSLLTSWLQSGDRSWKKAIDPEIAKRQQELDRLKKKDPKSTRIKTLEHEIKKLEDDWTL